MIVDPPLESSCVHPPWETPLDFLVARTNLLKDFYWIFVGIANEWINQLKWEIGISSKGSRNCNIGLVLNFVKNMRILGTLTQGEYMMDDRRRSGAGQFENSKWDLHKEKRKIEWKAKLSWVKTNLRSS